MTPGARRAIRATLREKFNLTWDACSRKRHLTKNGNPCDRCREDFHEMRLWMERELLIDARRRRPRGQYRRRR